VEVGFEPAEYLSPCAAAVFALLRNQQSRNDYQWFLQDGLGSFCIGSVGIRPCERSPGGETKKMPHSFRSGKLEFGPIRRYGCHHGAGGAERGQRRGGSGRSTRDEDSWLYGQRLCREEPVEKGSYSDRQLRKLNGKPSSPGESRRKDSARPSSKRHPLPALQEPPSLSTSRPA